MMNSHNFSTVVAFEVRRTITKRRFWIATLIVPFAIAIVFALVVTSNNATSQSLNAQKSTNFSFGYTDYSSIIDKSLVAKLGGTAVQTPSIGVSEVRSGRLDAYFEYPKNPSTSPVLVYGKDVGIFNNNKYSSVATNLLSLSAQRRMTSPALAPLIRGTIKVTTATYLNGVLTPGLKGVIPPLIYLVIFYLVIVLLGNQMLNSTLEEKENRVTEMILTTVDANTLIVGKIASLFISGLIQMSVFLSPVIIGYLFFRSSLNLPNVDLTTLVFNPEPMIVGVLLLFSGFALFTGTLVAIGAVMPTAKEAAGFFAVVMAMIFIPFYISSLIVSHPTALVVEVFTYFPFTAPVTAMIRNGFGSISLMGALAVLVELSIVSTLVLRLAVYLFRFGSIEYSKKVSIRTALGFSK